MKRCCVMLLMLLCLTGCAARTTAETVADEWLVPALASPGHITVELPGEAALPVMENDQGRVYICNDYEIMVGTQEGGDLNATIHSLSGLDRKNLTVVETEEAGATRYEFVWAAAGETGDRTGRAVILDDGVYHYCLSALLDADAEASQVNWNQMFDSFHIVP